MTERIYLDANATTPVLPEVAEAMARALHDTWGNPSSQHAEGRRARRAVDDAREALAALVGAPPAWLSWTSGGTEALNTWLHGIVAGPAAADRAAAGHPPWLVTTTAEHPAVEATVTALVAAGRARVRRLDTDRLGRLDPELMRAALRELDGAAAGAAVIAAHNETGGTQDVPALAAAAADAGVPLLLDGVQWTGKLPADIQDWGIGGWALSAHKFGGPKGVGALVAPPGTLAHALLTGGPQERRRRGGTENVPGIVGAGVAAQLAAAEGEARRTAWRQQLAALRDGLRQAWPEAVLVHDPTAGLPQTLLVRFPGWRGEVLAQRLDLEGIAVSTGSACSSGAVRASDALTRSGWDEAEAGELVRVSLVPRSENEELARLLEVLAEIRACS